MDWKNLTADVNLWLTKHYTKGRTGTIDRIILHHNAGNLTVQGCYNVWQSREASAHYQVQGDGVIGQLVHDYDTAWHCPGQNYRSIGIEHANNSTNPWTISDAALESGAHLVAALCVYYKLGRPTWGKNVFGHNDFNATACPGQLGTGGSQNAAYMKRAQEWYDSMSSGTDAPAASSSTTTSSSAITVDGKWGCGTSLALQKYLKAPYQDGKISGQNAAYKSISAGCLYNSFEWVKGGGSGSPTIKLFQKHIGMSDCDGFVGPKTWKAFIAYGITHGSGVKYNDGKIDDPSATVKWMQKSLNAGTF